jgi:hypothetical protein
MTVETRQNLSFSTPVLLLIVTTMLSTPSAWAAHPLITEDAYTLGAGVAQIEVGVEHARFDQSKVQDGLTTCG